ncbi:MAG: acetate/propionate family kinase [Methylovulum sp.]|nr:acetate/propionate family kinase [Methylovulum sp.]
MIGGCLLVVNVGSTSIKSRLFSPDLQPHTVLTADYGTAAGLVVEGKDTHGGPIYHCINTAHNTSAALTVVLNQWRQIITDNNLPLVAIGHRVVHGASWFDTVTPINADVLDRLRQLDCYAPLHNPFNRLGITMAAEFFRGTTQFAVFDTAFHRSIPEYAGRYAIPDRLSDKVDFYRYGFHGISCQHSLLATAKLLARDPATLNLIVLHLGGGASATAIRAGASIDTSMGFSPTEGLMMAGRCGDLDPMIVLTLQKDGMSPEQLDNLLNKNSGLRGICGDADMRGILQKAGQHDPAAMLALDMFCYRIKKYIGAYCAILGEVCALVFTGGIGEHAPEIRSRILTGLEPLGFTIDNQANRQQTGQNSDISEAASRSRILVIHAEEERVCAQQILNFLDGKSNDNPRGE